MLRHLIEWFGLLSALVAEYVVRKYKNFRLMIRIGTKLIHFHHSYTGLILVSSYPIMPYLAPIGVGLIAHHLITEDIHKIRAFFSLRKGR
jgi:uncharacterized membrane protein